MHPILPLASLALIATTQSTGSIRVIPRPLPSATSLPPWLTPTITTCPDFPGRVLTINRSRTPGLIRNGDLVTITGNGFGTPGSYSMLTMWPSAPPWQVGTSGYILERVSWSDTRIVGRVKIIRQSSYAWDISLNAYLEITRTKLGRPVKCGVRGLKFSRFPEA